MSHAANALKAFESGDLDGALKELSELWQESRAPEAADALELVAAKAAPPRAPPWKTVAERDAAWRALEGTLRPAVLGPLLETLFDVPTKWVRARLDLLDSRWPADPRAARSLVHIMQTTYARGATSYHLWKKLCEMIARQADPRVLPALEKLDVAHRGSQPVAITAALNRTNLFAKTAHLIRQQLRSFALPLTADEQAVISTIRAAFAAHREHSVSRAKTADDFLAEIYENPGDDQLRQVFADWLLEQGDPRGEFINLQLAKTKTTASRRREATLLRELGRRWLGALEPVVLKDGVVFERGFPAALRLRVKSLRVAKEIVGRPEWSTVRWLDVRGWAYGSLPALLLSPVMRSLRAVHGCGLAMLSIDGPVAWEELGIDGDASRMYRIESLDGFRATKAFPEVRSLHLVDVIVDPEQARPLWTSEFGRRLKSFDLQIGRAHV